MRIDQRNRLTKALSPFNLEQLCNFIVKEFRETSWHQIQKTIKTSKVPLTHKFVHKYLINILEQEKVASSVVDERITSLTLLGVAISKRKTWTTIQMVDKVEDVFWLDKIETNVSRSLKRSNYVFKLNIIKHNTKIIMGVEKMNIGKKRTTSTSFDFIYVLPYPYIFCSRKSIKGGMIQAIVEGLGYTNYKYPGLEGKDVSSLLTLLRSKEGHDMNTLFFREELQYKQQQPSFEDEGNFSQYNTRKQYADRLFGETPPKMQLLTVKTQDYIWQKTDNYCEMEGKSFNMGLKLHSPNIPAMLKSVITEGYTVMPLPSYLENALKPGRNHLKIRQAN